MFDNDYEEYMRSVLGYPSSENTYYVGQGMFPYRNNDNTRNFSNLYPEIYKKLKPHILKACNEYRSIDISDDIVEQITNDICDKFEAESNSELQENPNKKIATNTNVRGGSKQNNNEKPPKQNNPLLKDLIKILLINQLINNNTNRPPRPPINPYPPRPRGISYEIDSEDLY